VRRSAQRILKPHQIVECGLIEDRPRSAAHLNLWVGQLTDLWDNACNDDSHGAGETVMARYFFDVRSNEWDYRDPDGIALADDEAAVTYAESMIGELKADGGYNAPELQMLVKDELQRTMVVIPFHPAKVMALGKSHAVMPIGIA
jgi:hypothetical protein